MRGMASYDLLLPRVLPQTQPCPGVMALDAVRQVAVDFCTRAEIWRDVLTERVFPGASAIDLPLERDTALVRVVELRLDGAVLSPGDDFTASPRAVDLAFDPPRELTARIAVVLRPSRLATRLPEEMLEEWGDVLAFGALAKLKSMSGPHVAWSDPQGAALNLQLYEQGVARAGIRVLRGRDGRSLRMGDRAERCV